jgi:CBS domain-containing protein
MDFERSLATETVEEAQIQPAVIVSSECTVRDALQRMRENRVGDVLVCDGGKLVGIFTERDALRLMHGDTDWDWLMPQVMAKNIVSVRKTDSMLSAIRKMNDGGYRRLPVVDDKGQVLGVLTVSGVVHYLVEHFPKTVYNLPPDPHLVMQEREGA